MNRLLTLAALLCLAVTTLFSAGNSRADEAADGMTAEKFLAGLHFRSAPLELPTAKATITPKNGFKVLDAKDAQKVLSELWGNPPDDSVLAMLVPGDVSLADEHGWGVMVTFSDDGYVSDDDAAKIDYDQLLKDMQQGTRDNNEARKRAGYGTIELVGWATKPHYDATGKKMYWARELKGESNPVNTLNYDIRMLGRRGYLSLNAIAAMPDMSRVQSGMQDVLSMAEFAQGERYADYNSSTDKAAAYGLAALVAGGVAAKAGLFGKLLALLLAAKKLVLVAIAAIGAFLKKLFSRNKA